jgi:hypothetical protein
MTNALPSSIDASLQREVAGPGDPDETPVVELSAEQLYALCLALAYAVEDDHPAPELAAVRSVLESVEVRLLLAWADMQMARWDARDADVAAGEAGVA